MAKNPERRTDITRIFFFDGSLSKKDMDNRASLYILGEECHDIPTIKHLKTLSKIIKEDYQQNKSVVKSLVLLYQCDMCITISRAAYQTSKFYDKIISFQDRIRASQAYISQ